MTDSHEIELFILKNAVITKELRSAFITNRVRNVRGALEIQANSLVADYLKQVDFETLADAERMSEFYKLFYALENDIRDLIESTMVDSKGSDWWNTAVRASRRVPCRPQHRYHIVGGHGVNGRGRYRPAMVSDVTAVSSRDIGSRPFRRCGNYELLGHNRKRFGRVCLSLCCGLCSTSRLDWILTLAQ
jgi:hypothetical protein